MAGFIAEWAMEGQTRCAEHRPAYMTRHNIPASSSLQTQPANLRVPTPGSVWRETEAPVLQGSGMMTKTRVHFRGVGKGDMHYIRKWEQDPSSSNGCVFFLLFYMQNESFHFNKTKSEEGHFQ